MLKRIEVRQLPWARPVEVKGTFLEPSGEKINNFLLKKRSKKKIGEKRLEI